MKNKKIIILLIVLLILSLTGCKNKNNTDEQPDDPAIEDNTNNPDNPNEGDNTDTPNNPNDGDSTDTPDIPNDGDNTDTPNIPNEGDNTDTPNNPNEGDNTDTPNNPNDGDNTDAPNNPNEGDNTDTPDIPNEGDNTDTPDIPNEGDNTDTPNNPNEGDNADAPNNPNEGDNTDTPNIPNEGDNTSGLPDNLGGGGTGEQTPETDVDYDNLPGLDDVENNNNQDTDLTDNHNIDLSKLTTNTLTLKNAGSYELTGTFIGNVIVKGDASEITIVLNNVKIQTLNGEPAIIFEKHSGSRTLHILPNTTNTLSDSIGSSEDSGAVIQAKKSNLTINGSGSLTITAKGPSTTGIKVKHNLTISDTTIRITSTNDGIKAGETLNIQNSNITINSSVDGIKTDIEASTTQEGNTLTKDAYAGYIYIKNSNISITTGDDGISANSLLKIDNTNSHTIRVTTNGGAPSSVTESSSNSASGKAIKTDGIAYVNPTTGISTDLASQTTDNYLLIILGGNFNINSNGDGLASKGNLYIKNGAFTISSGDDAIHSEYLTSIYAGNITITKSYEGIEGASVEIHSGNITINSSDDGINAANDDLPSYRNNIYIGGGNIVVNANGDGVDSNGTIEFAGGVTTIWGPTRNDNAALDADSGVLVNGGEVYAYGAAGMVETPANNSALCSIVYNLSTSVAQGEMVKVTDSTGNVIYQTTVQKTFQSFVISTSSLKMNETYTITLGSNTESITITKIVNQLGNSFGPGGAPGGPGAPGGGGGRPPRP